MHLRNSGLKRPDIDPIVQTLANFFGSVVHRIEFSRFVRVADVLEQATDIVSASQLCEIILRDVELVIVRWEDQVNGFGLVTVILYND